MTLPRLSQRLTLETPTRASDGAGGFTESWTALGVLWAQVLPRSGSEGADGPMSISRVSYKIIVRAAPVGHPERPLPQQRFRDGTRLFRITAVTESDAAGHYLTCFADEEVAS